jgi:hypothetical protein
MLEERGIECGKFPEWGRMCIKGMGEKVVSNTLWPHTDNPLPLREFPPHCVL